jgi:hypothetical protein
MFYSRQDEAAASEHFYMNIDTNERISLRSNMMRFASLLLRDKHVVEDVVQETMWQSLNTSMISKVNQA